MIMCEGCKGIIEPSKYGGWRHVGGADVNPFVQVQCLEKGRPLPTGIRLLFVRVYSMTCNETLTITRYEVCPDSDVAGFIDLSSIRRGDESGYFEIATTTLKGTTLTRLRTGLVASRKYLRSATIQRELQSEGIAVGKQRGNFNGCHPALSIERALELRKRIAAGEPKSKLAKELNISRESLYKTYCGATEHYPRKSTEKKVEAATKTRLQPKVDVDTFRKRLMAVMKEGKE
jgi:hypothetical protein